LGRIKSISRGGPLDSHEVGVLSDSGLLDLAFHEPGSTGWLEAWNGLAWALREHGLGDGNDLAQVNSLLGDRWQYMGTVSTAEVVQAELGRRDPITWHEFRHRAHPTGHDVFGGCVTYPRIYLRVRGYDCRPPEPDYLARVSRGVADG